MDQEVKMRQRIMFHYVYVIESEKTPDPYVGYSTNLKERIKEHNQGESEYTKKYIPWQLIHYEAYVNKKDARRRERYLKTSQGARLLKRMLKEYYYDKQKRR